MKSPETALLFRDYKLATINLFDSLSKKTRVSDEIEANRGTFSTQTFYPDNYYLLI